MYKVVLKKRAKKFIDRLPQTERKRLVSAIELLPKGENIKPLKRYENLFRLRVGDYRVIYTIDNGELMIMVIDAGSRGDIYKRY